MRHAIEFQEMIVDKFSNYIRATYTIWVTLRKIFDNKFSKLREGDIYKISGIM